MLHVSHYGARLADKEEERKFIEQNQSFHVCHFKIATTPTFQLLLQTVVGFISCSMYF